MLRAQHQNRGSLGIDIISAESGHGICEGSYYFVWIRLNVLGHAMRRFGIDYGHCAFIGCKMPLKMQGLPRIRFLMLGNTKCVLSGMAVLAKIHVARNCAANVDENQSQRSSDRRIGFPPWAKGSISII